MFKHDFCETINPMCACGAEVETTGHFLLSCHLYSTQKSELFDWRQNVDLIFLNFQAKDRVLVLLHGSKTYNSKNFNGNIFTILINYFKTTSRFDKPIISFCKLIFCLSWLSFKRNFVNFICIYSWL